MFSRQYPNPPLILCEGTVLENPKPDRSVEGARRVVFPLRLPFRSRCRTKRTAISHPRSEDSPWRLISTSM
ncbi:protein of unknown function [Magnetospira sp. QH-2]|nr:protein of unknown function [Magnetospira sp. QH-2]